MHTEREAQPARPSILRRVAAGLVLIIVAALVLKLAIGFAVAIFGTIVLIAAIIAVLWALKTLLW